MAAGSTYTPIATQTLGSATATVTFSSLGSYTDIVLIFNGTMSSAAQVMFRLNSDTGNNYSYTKLYGQGGAAGSARESNISGGVLGYYNGGSSPITQILHIQNFGNSNTYKTTISRSSDPGNIESSVSLWRNTSAITSISILNTGGVNIASGTTITLYGIAAA